MNILNRRRCLPLILLLLALAACSPPSETETLVQVRAQLKQRDHATAIVTLKQALQANERFTEARLLLGQATLESGDAAAAVAELRKALALGADANVVLPLLAQALLASGQAEALIGEHAATRLSQPDAHAQLRTLLAAALFDRQQVDAAEQSLQDALSASPGYAPALLLQARTLGAAGGRAQALALLQSLLDNQPKLAAAWLLRGQLLAADKSLGAGAAAAFDQVLTLEPRNRAAHQALVQLALAQGDRLEARKRLQQFGGAWPGHPQTLTLQVQVALFEGDLSSAGAAVQQLLARSPVDPLAQRLAGEVASRAGARSAASNHFENAVRLAPQSASLRLLLAQTQVRGGDPAAALATLEPVLRAAAPPAAAMGIAGEARLQLGQVVQARDWFARAASADPGEARYRVAQAVMALSAGGSSASLSSLEAMAAKDTTGTADVALANAHMARKNAGAAIKSLERAERKQAQNFALPLLRGKALETLGRPREARLAFDAAQRLDPQQLGPVLALAERDLADGQRDAALKRLDVFTQAHPGQLPAQLALADLQGRTGAAAGDVRATLEAAMRGHPRDVAPVMALARHHLAHDEPAASRAVVQAALATLPGNAELLALLGSAQLALGEVQPAISTLSRVVAARQRDPQALVALAQAQRLAGERRGAAERFAQALQIDPGHGAARRGLLDLALDEKRWDAALDMARQQQKRKPDSAEGWQLEAAVFAAQKRWPDAVAPLRNALARRDASAVAIELHAALVAAGQQPLADQLVIDWRSRHPGDMAFVMHVGDTAGLLGDLPQAETMYRLVLTSRPNDVQALNNLAWALTQQNKAGAVELAERANRLAPDRPLLMDTWAGALAADRQIGKALQLQKKAVAVAPTQSTLRLHLAQLALQGNDKALARQELERLAELGTGFARHAEVRSLQAQAR